MRSPALLAAGAAALAMIAAAPALSSPRSGPAASAATTAAPVKVVMRHNKFRPRRVVVPLGRTVRWKNLDDVPHTVVTANGPLHSDAIRGGETFRFKPRKRGTIRYFCTIHANQNGVLVVR
jgi:plastocyanin